MTLQERLVELEVFSPDMTAVLEAVDVKRTHRRKRLQLLAVCCTAAMVCAIAVGALVAIDRTSPSAGGDLGTAVSASSAASVAPPPPVLYTSMEGWNQETSDLFAPIMSDIAKAGQEDKGGFADISVNYVTSTGLVYWHGKMSPKAQAIIDKAASEGIHIEQIQVDYGIAELMAAMPIMNKAFAAAGLDLVAFGLDDSYSGLQVTGPDVITDAELQKRARDVAAEAVGMPIYFTPGIPEKIDPVLVGPVGG
ncbi:hypothetical protein D1871_07975 [Nakamurella silvestris]|nr:hypothetical protein D1871_07975 [Nakamurella silvestris]